MRTHDFVNSIKVGEFGEQIIKKYLLQKDNILHITDVSKIPDFQKQDIDLVVDFRNGKRATIEIKTDTYTSGNIFYETLSNKEYNVPGCMEKSSADFLFYYFTKTNELYIINFRKYREWFHQNISLFSKKEFYNMDRSRTGKYTSVGYTIPKSFLENNFSYYKKEILL